MNTIVFNANEPQVLKLKDTVGCIDGFNVLYETSDGNILALPRPAAVKLNMLDPQPDEEISVTKYRKDREPAEWVIALTARSEQARASREAEAAEKLAREQAEATRRDTAGQLAASISAARSLRQVPKLAQMAAQDQPETGKGTGTYGPAPEPVRVARIKAGAIPMNVAVQEVVQFVTVALHEAGEQWSDGSKQDLISTAIIAAGKMGLLGVWER